MASLDAFRGKLGVLMRIWIVISSTVAAMALVAIAALVGFETWQRIQARDAAAALVAEACEGVTPGTEQARGFTTNRLQLVAEATVADPRWQPLLEAVIAAGTFDTLVDIKETTVPPNVDFYIKSREGDLLVLTQTIYPLCKEVQDSSGRD